MLVDATYFFSGSFSFNICGAVYLSVCKVGVVFMQYVWSSWQSPPPQVSNILKYLFPVPKDDSRRVITFANQDDFISFR